LCEDVVVAPPSSASSRRPCAAVDGDVDGDADDDASARSAAAASVNISQRSV
jgi:hypothetical protein